MWGLGGFECRVMENEVRTELRYIGVGAGIQGFGV